MDRLAVLVVAGFLLQARHRLLERLHVGEDQLGLDDLDVGRGVDLAVDVHHVVVGEHAHHLTDGVALTDVGEELVAQPAPSDAPFTMPAMSTNVTGAGTVLSDENISASLSSRGSGSATTPSFGSMVANG